jgi:hypothetical protein
MAVDFRTRRQIASASSSGSRMAFGGDGSGGGNMAPSLELAIAPVELDEVGFVGEEDIVATGGAVEEGGGFGDVVAPGTDGLRMIRALGGIVMA